MRRIAGLSPLLVVIFVFVLALPQFAFAQRLKPIPHPIGVMQHPAAQAATQTGPEAHAQVRAAASTARAFVESLTTSVFRTVATTRFWLIGATVLQVPRGATGDSSIPVNRAGSSCHSRLSTTARRRGSDAAGRTNRSCCQRRITSAAVIWSARALATAISRVCKSVGDRSCSRASQAPAGRARRTRSAARSRLSGIWLLSQTSRSPRTVCTRSALSPIG